MNYGELVRIVFSSADASTAAAVSLYNLDGVAVTLSGNDRLTLKNLVISVTGAIGVDVFDDADAGADVDAAERLVYVLGTTGNPTFPISFTGEGQPCGRARLPKVKASGSGAIVITGNGYVTKA